MQELEPASLPARRKEPRALMSRPQRLGILPTLWFWQEVRAEHPVIGMLTGVAVGLFAAIMGKLLLAVGLNLPVVFVAALCLPLVGLGIIERGLRRLVLRRRRPLARGGSRGELPSNEEKAPDARRS